MERVRAVAGDHFAVIMGANAALLRASVAISATNVHEFDEWHLGHASSLRAGLAAAPPDAPAVLVTLIDQPLVTARDLDHLVSRWQEHPTQAAAAAYDDVLGAPCILPRSWFAKVMALQGDRGASALLRASADVISVTMPNAAYDIDTTEDLKRLHHREASSPTDSATD